MKQSKIKYIEDNLCFNTSGECFAYYELLPFHYAFLSDDEKMKIHLNFQQLVSQTKGDRLHILVIGAEKSIREIQEDGKKGISGNLKEVALHRIDGQTEALVENLGENEVGYRYFIGFRLSIQQEDFTLASLKDTLKRTLLELVQDISTEIMGEFTVVDKTTLERYHKVEELLYHRLENRFAMRKITKNDYGYLIAHINGLRGAVMDDYDFPLRTFEEAGYKKVRKYDLLSPMRVEMVEEARNLKIVSEKEKETYSSYFVISEVTDTLDFPSTEFFYLHQKNFSFPVDVSVQVEVIENKKSLSRLNNQKKELEDNELNAYESGSSVADDVAEALEDIEEISSRLSKTKEDMYKISYVIRVFADTKEILRKRCNEVRDFYDSAKIKILRPLGDQLGLHFEFFPASCRYRNDYVQFVGADFLASLGFGATQKLGEESGIYIGYTRGTGSNVYIQPSLPARGVRGSITNSLTTLILGNTGGGKSMFNKLLTYYVAVRGGKTLTIDPKNEAQKWSYLKELGDELNIITLTSKEEDRGLLDPFLIMSDDEDKKSLALSILSYLTGVSIQDGEGYPLLREAVDLVLHSEKQGLYFVVDELKKMGSDKAKGLANHIESFTDIDFSKLLFSFGEKKKSITCDSAVNILQVAELLLPDSEKAPSEYENKEILSIATMVAISTFCLDFAHSDNSVFKICNIEEAWSQLQVSSGKALLNRLNREGRGLNSGLNIITQNSKDVAGFENNLGMKFAFRSRDEEEITKILELFDCDVDDENNRNTIKYLNNGECLFQDIYGRVGVVCIDLIYDDFMKAWDSRPELREEEERG